jgi:hypothetical protein
MGANAERTDNPDRRGDGGVGGCQRRLPCAAQFCCTFLLCSAHVAAGTGHHMKPVSFRTTTTL